MGMFDWVTCEVPLPNGAKLGTMQSKDLECYMDDLRISADGRLLVKQSDGDWKDLNYHGDFNFYGDETVGEPQPILRFGRWSYERERVWHEYYARFTEGQLTKIWVVDDAAQGTEAQRAETVEQGSVHDGPVGEADAPKTCPGE